MTFVLTPPYDILLRGSDALPIGLYHLHQATAAQLCRLHYAQGSLKAVKKKLKILAEYGYVQSDKVPTRQYSSPYYYTLGQKGWDYLKSLGYDVNEAWRESKEVNKSWLFLDHALELNDLIISAALLSRSFTAYTLEQFKTDRQLKREPYRVSWASPTGNQHFTIIPDAALKFNVGNILLEHDRGTEEQQHFRRRIRAYAMLLKSQGVVTVAFTTFKGDARLEKMRSWTRAELEGEPAYVKHAFRFITLVQPIDPTIWLSGWKTLDNDTPLALLAA